MELKDAKVGDELYTTGSTGNSAIKIYKIVRITKTMIFLSGGMHSVGLKLPEIKISMNGVQVGSRGTGRFAGFSTITWYLVDDKVRLEYKVQKLNRAINKLGERVSSMKATSETFSEYEKAGSDIVDILNSLGIK